MPMTVKELKDYLDQLPDQDIPVYFYQYEEANLLSVELEELSVDYIERSKLDHKVRIVPMSETKALIIT